MDYTRKSIESVFLCLVLAGVCLSLSLFFPLLSYDMHNLHRYEKRLF